MPRRRNIIIAVVSVFLLPTLLFAILNIVFPLPPQKPYSTIIKDRNGAIIGAYLAADDIWRINTAPEEIPARLKALLIAKEDRYFPYHPGVNPFSIVRAVAQNLTSGRRVSGASTITMQVARMLEPKDRTYAGKIVEMFRACQLEMRYSKDEILAMYLSLVPLGGNIEGLQSASYIYYQTPLERLNIAQLLDLIIIPNDPNDFRPDRHPDRLLAGRLRTATLLQQRGVISSHDSTIIAETPAAATRHRLPDLAPHFALRMKSQRPRGGTIVTTLDLTTERIAAGLLARHMHGWKQLGVNNGALIIVNNATRDVLAYIGSENFGDSLAQGQVDAIRALRSPGSTLKPFLVAMEMDNGTITPKTRLLDTPYDAEGFYAENYSGTYSGLVYADDALRRSLNVPMIRLLKQRGVTPFLDRLHLAGFSSLDAQRPRLGLSVILGGCGVRLDELVAAFAAFPNGGAFRPLRYELTKTPLPDTRLFSPSAAYMVTEILAGIDRPDLPNNFESAINLPKVAFKTGTSYGRRDAWAIGYSSEFTIGVWMGNVNHRGSPELTGGKAAAPLLVDLFTSISTKRQKTILPIPGDVQLRDVCATSGLAPTPRCSHIIEDYYSIRRTVNRYCTIDREYLVSPDATTQYCPACLGRHPYRARTFADYPAELVSFWSSTGQSFTHIPPHNPSCAQTFAGEGPKIVSPSQDMTYFIVSSSQKIALRASSPADIAEHIWYIDDRYLSREKASDKLFVTLSDGEHTVSCMDDRGRLSTVRIRVKHVL